MSGYRKAKSRNMWWAIRDSPNSLSNTLNITLWHLETHHFGLGQLFLDGPTHWIALGIRNSSLWWLPTRKPKTLLFPQPVKSGAAKGLSWGFSCGPITMKDGHLSFVIGYLVGVTFADGRCSDWRIRYVLESGVQWLYTFILIKTKPKTANLPTTPFPKCPSPFPPWWRHQHFIFLLFFSGSALGLLF